MNIHILQHVPFEGPAAIEEWALRNQHTITTTRFYAQEHLPSLQHFDLLIVMGGPMSIHEEHLYNWLKAEKWFIQQVIEAEKPVLGICLGAQLIAQVLGAEVIPGEQKEIGWFPLTLDKTFQSHPLGQRLATELTVFHWHGESFTLPDGAQRIASSEICENQGFIYEDRVIALQYHIETTPYSVEEIIAHCRDELVDAPYIQSEEQILSHHEYYPVLHHELSQVLEYMELLCLPEGSG